MLEKWEIRSIEKCIIIHKMFALNNSFDYPTGYCCGNQVLESLVGALFLLEVELEEPLGEEWWRYDDLIGYAVTKPHKNILPAIPRIFQQTFSFLAGKDYYEQRQVIEGDFEKSSKQEKFEVYNAIRQKSKKLKQIIDDIMYSAELDTAEFILTGKELTNIDLAPYLEKIIQNYQDEAEEKKIKLELADIPAGMLKIVVSERYLEAVLDNLIINALTYTKAGGKIEIKIKPQKDTIRIEIKDNGIGISSEDQKEIGVKFKRGRNANSMNTDGSGLGLFIVKTMIAAHPKGKFGFKSKLGQGSVFWIEVERGV